MQKIKVVIASPGDVKRERELIRSTILTTVNVWAKILNIEFEVIDWENSTYPSVGNYSQEVINNQFGGCIDLVIGAFWYRLGTPTPNFPSGTVEEIERAVNKQKEGENINVKLYYKSKPVPKKRLQESQLDAVHKWRDYWSKRGVYYWSFKESSDISDLITKHLGLYIERKYFIDENTNESTKKFLQPLPTSSKTVIEYLQDFISISVERKDSVSRITGLIDENTQGQDASTRQLNHFLKLPKSSKVQRQISLLLVQDSKNAEKYASNLKKELLLFKEFFVRGFDSYSSAILVASQSSKKDRKAMRKITDEIPELIELYRKLHMVICESIKAIQGTIDQYSAFKDKRLLRSETLVKDCYVQFKLMTEDFTRILEASQSASKKLLRRRLLW